MYNKKTLKKFYNKKFGETQEYIYNDTINSGFGKIYTFYHPRQQKFVMMKQRRFKTKKEYQKFLGKVLDRQKLFHPKINRFLGFSSEYNKAGKLVDFIIRRFYEHHKDSLENIVQQYQQNYTDFKSEELLYLVYDILEAGSFLQSNGLFHGLISPDMILRSKNFIYVLGDNLKYKSDSPQNVIEKYICSQSVYLAPEIFKAICLKNSDFLNKANMYKADIFCVGLCILFAGLKNDPTNIYNKINKSFSPAQLQNYIQQFQQKFNSNSLLVTIVKSMLQVDTKNRPCFQSIFHALPNRQILMQYFTQIRNSKNTSNQIKPMRSQGNNIINRRQRSISKNKLNNSNKINTQKQVVVQMANRRSNSPINTQNQKYNMNIQRNQYQEIQQNYSHNIFQNPQQRSRTYVSKSPDYSRQNVKKSYTIFEN